MFGYRLIHKDVLAWLMARADGVDIPSSEPSSVTWTSGPAVSVRPSPRAVPLEDAAGEVLPVEVVQAVAGWEPGEQARLTGLARDLLDSGMAPKQVAHVIAAGEPVTD